VIRHLVVVFLLIVALADLASATESGPENLSCSASSLSALREATFTLDVGKVHLRNGRDCLAFPGSPCDWDVQLTRAETWGKDRQFLLVIVNANHLLGSGAWDSIFLYVCKGGIFKQVLADRFSYGVKLELGDDADFWTTAGAWAKRDPACCPSSERHTHLVWNRRQSRFVVTESTTTLLKRPD
jgi:hypothetical protein